MRGADFPTRDSANGVARQLCSNYANGGQECPPYVNPSTIRHPSFNVTASIHSVSGKQCAPG